MAINLDTVAVNKPLKKAVMINVEIPSDSLKKKQYKVQEISMVIRAKIAVVESLNLSGASGHQSTQNCYPQTGIETPAETQKQTEVSV